MDFIANPCRHRGRLSAGGLRQGRDRPRPADGGDRPARADDDPGAGGRDPGGAVAGHQCLAGRRRRRACFALVRRMWPMLAGICIGTFIAARLLPSGNSGQATVWLGLALVIYAGLGLIKMDFTVPPRAERWLGLPVGRADRRDHRRDRHLRAAGHALCARAAVRPRPTGAGARPVVHGLDRHAWRRADACRRDAHVACLRRSLVALAAALDRHVARANGARPGARARRSGCGSSSACCCSARIWRCAGCCDRLRRKAPVSSGSGSLR